MRRRDVLRRLGAVLVAAPLAPMLPTPSLTRVRIDNRLYIDGREITTEVVRLFREASQASQAVAQSLKAADEAFEKLRP